MGFPFLSIFIFVPFFTHGTLLDNNNGHFIGVYDNTTQYNFFEANAYCMNNYGSSLASYHSNISEYYALNARVANDNSDIDSISYWFK